MKKQYSIILADDHPLLRKGLKDIIDAIPGFHVIAEAGDGEEALALINGQRPDIAVLDIDMPRANGLEVVKRAGQERLPTKIIILTMHDKEVLLRRALDLGAMGYVMKDSVISEIRQALKSVAAGKHYITPSLSGLLVKNGNIPSPDERIGISQLTPMERRVIRLIAESKTTKQIADALSISNRTIDSHRRNICSKLSLHGPGSLIRFAMENKDQL